MTLPGPTGGPASPAGVTAGKSLTRSIAQGCSLKLDDPDDSENSSADFSESDPSPRNNSVVPTETNCPETSIQTGPAQGSFTNQTSAAFTYTATQGATSFSCKLDNEAEFSDCSNGTTTGSKTYPGPLAPGQHTFQVKAAGDSTPAARTWTVDTTDPDTTISSTGLPTNPTASPTATFSFSASEPTGATFRCKLDQGLEEDCTTGKSYSNLLTGEHTFTVYARDRAGNQDDSPATYVWMVDRSPPDTNIISGPTQPTSTVNTATFVFEELPDEPGVTFECRLITPTVPSPSFSACPPSYQGLGEGQHTFEVRAADALGNADQTPDSWTWEVDAISTPAPDTTITKAPKPRGTDTTPKIIFTATNSPAPPSSAGSTTSPTRPAPRRTRTKKLKLGKHTFEVFATGPGGVEPQAAKASFKIVKRR